LEGAHTPPDPNTSPSAFDIWAANDNSLCGFILLHSTLEEEKVISHLPTARDMFAALRVRHEKLGPQSQILLLEKASRTKYQPGVRLMQTWDELDTLMRQLKASGPLDYDTLQIAYMIHGLGEHFEHLRLVIQSIANQPNFTLDDVARRLSEEDDLIRYREERGLVPPSTALTSQAKSRVKTTCSRCKRVGHFAEFCIQPGGKMAGKTLEEAMAAYRASRASGKKGAMTTTSPSTPLVIQGVTYDLVPRPAAAPSGSSPSIPPANIAELDDNAGFDFYAGIAMCGDPCASVDWSAYSRPASTSDASASVAYSASRVPIRSLEDSPFFLDTGANAHISPERSDFKSLRTIE
jgi:hypothetical protein